MAGGRIVFLVPRANLETKTRLIKNTSLISDPGEAAETALALPAGPICECPLALPLREGHSRVSRVTGSPWNKVRYICNGSVGHAAVTPKH